MPPKNGTGVLKGLRQNEKCAHGWGGIPTMQCNGWGWFSVGGGARTSSCRFVSVQKRHLDCCYTGIVLDTEGESTPDTIPMSRKKLTRTMTDQQHKKQIVRSRYLIHGFFRSVSALDTHREGWRAKKKNVHPGCLTHVMSDIFYSVVANRRQPNLYKIGDEGGNLSMYVVSDN